ncbi:hypothetical protein AB1Y20_020996 [Prymnesium parvum]|uniref:Endoplasmic reticulum transmembrane protein n=1 Tax=Prymnesium parvum TaxID=97485 RepID=A0AB34JIE7_PRYPA|mmetsp:Transcript_32806/g.68752  ORF Transcript_32806/g.68752 Transcript_32806/m.68752 type:complete len:246 (-) Transcript_32806:370-1107(-)
MSSLNGATFVLLCVELSALLVMIAPLPGFLRASLVRFIGTSSLLSALQRPVMYLSFFVLIMFASTVREVYKYTEQYGQVKVQGVELANKLQVEVMMFRAQRNFYLSGACCLLLLVIYRIYGQLKEINQLQATGTALKKQADGAMTAYKALQAEKEELQKKLKAAAAGDAAASDATPPDDEIKRLRERVDKLAAERTAAEKSSEALKRQSEAQATEYARLMEENKSLQNKLADFELVMGDSAKKQK